MSDTPRAPAIGRQTKSAPSRAGEKPTALVMGGTGSFGGGVVEVLLEQGRNVRVLVRDNASAVRRFGAFSKATLHKGNAFDPESLEAAAQGCGVIYYGINLPFSQWESGARAALENTIGVAKRVGAGIVFPGNVWVYGPRGEGGAPVDESSAFDANTRKGRIRMELEGLLRESAERGDARSLVVRAGDFFGPTVRNPYHDGIFGAAQNGKPMLALGSLDAPHQWAYVPDLARVCVKLADAMEKMHAHEVFHFAGHSFETQKSFYDHVKVCAQDASLKVRHASWLTLRAASLVNKDMKELLELRYLWDEGLAMDDTRLRRVWPGFAPTDVDEAISRTLVSYR